MHWIKKTTKAPKDAQRRTKVIFLAVQPSCLYDVICRQFPFIGPVYNPVGEATLRIMAKRKVVSSLYGHSMDRSSSVKKIEPLIEADDPDPIVLILTDPLIDCKSIHKYGKIHQSWAVAIISWSSQIFGFAKVTLQSK